LKSDVSTLTVLTVSTDITVEKDVQNLYDLTQQKFCRHAVVLMNVAGYLEEPKMIGEQNVDAWWKRLVSLIETNWQWDF
jgi:NADP-dependent 3-hydroxy acid dehydrogenase YdfG